MTSFLKAFTLMSVTLSICINEQVFCQTPSVNPLPEDYTNLAYQLLMPYDTNVPPSQPLELRLKIMPTKVVKLDVENGILTLDFWLQHVWFDERLSWNRSDFGTDRLFLKPNNIYTPKVVLYNGYATPLVSDPEIDLRWNGLIVYTQPLRAEIYCDLPAVPFRNSVCNITIGSWTRDASYLNLVSESPEVDISAAVQTGICKIGNSRARVDVKAYSCCSNSFVSMSGFLQLSCSGNRAFTAQTHRNRDFKNNPDDFSYGESKCSLPLIVAPSFVLLIFLLPARATDRVFLGAIVFLYLLLIWTSGPLTTQEQSFHRLSIGVTIVATFASLVSCRMNPVAGSSFYTRDEIEPKDSWCKRRFGPMIDLVMFVAAAVVLGIATTGLLA